MARLFRLHWLLCTTMLLAGCGESDTGMAVKKPASERPDVDRATVAKGSRLIPTSEPFNYATFRSGQSGAARGESAMVGKDGVHCSADANDGGSAWGSFQLGYCFDNAAGVPIDATVKLKLRLAENHSSKSPVGGPQDEETTGKTTLNFFIKDTEGHTLKSEELSTSNVFKGPRAETKVHDLVFDARFEPDRGYYLMLNGRTDAQASPGGSASATADIQETSLEIAWRPGEPKAAVNPIRRTSTQTASP